MVNCTTANYLQTSEGQHLLNYWEARMLDASILDARKNAYESGDFNRATKLETLAHYSHVRLNRRYVNMEHLGIKLI